MFVLERILRGLSEENSVSKTVYSDFLDKIREFKSKKADSDYHEKLRLLIAPFLSEAVKGLEFEIRNNLKIILLANDFKIKPAPVCKVDWIRIVKELIEVKSDLGLLVRLLRYLKSFGFDDGLNNEIPLLLLNTVNKMLFCNDQGVIGQVLQIIKIVNFQEIDGGLLLRPNLLKLLRGNSINDKIKWMILKILKRFGCFDSVDDAIILLGLKGMSALIQSELNDEYKNDAKMIPKSSSKVVNFLNGHFEDFSPIERSILSHKEVSSDIALTEYEKFISGIYFDVKDHRVLRELLRIDLLSVEEYLKFKIPLDPELIVSKTRNAKIFWEYLGKCDEFVTERLQSIELVREFYDHFKAEGITVDDQELPKIWFIFKLIQEFGSDEESRSKFKEIGLNLYERYKDNFDIQAQVFLL